MHASSAIKAILESGNTELKSGDEVVVTLSFGDYQEISKGINAYKATLEYSKSVFEEVLSSDFDTQNNWEELKFNKDTGEFVAIKKVGIKKPEEIVKIKLRVKENAKASKENVSIKDIVVSDGKKDILVQEAKIKFDIIQDQSNIQDNSDNQNSSNNGEETLKPNNEVEKDSPQTGDSSNWMFWFGLISLEAVIFIVYVKKDKLNKLDSKNKKMISIIIIGVMSLQVVGTVTVGASILSSKGELNEDGYIDYKDVNLLELYLINKGELSESVIDNADMNRDRRITVTDLSILVQKIEKTLDYEVALSDMEQYSYYPHKNEDINLLFLGDVNYNSVIKKAIINGKEYQVKKEEKDNVYSVNVGKSDTSGIKEYHFTEVVLNNDKRIDVDYSIKLDVLKNIPSIESYTINENIEDSKVHISFNLKDDDKSVQSAYIEILNDKLDSIQKKNIELGKNIIDVEVQEGKKYIVNFVVNYDLDSNKLIEHEQDNTGTLHETKEFDCIWDYNWEISDIVTDKDGLETTIFEKNQPINIKFNSSNSTRFEPEFAIVNDKEYPIKKENNQYVITIDSIEKSGEYEIRLQEIVLSNGKRFSITKNNIISVTISKDKPTVSEIDIIQDIESKKLTAKFELVDQDNTLSSAQIILLDDNNKEIDKKDIKVGENEIALNTILSNKYIVKIVATYNLADGKENITSTLLEQEVKAQTQAEIKEVNSSKYYVEKLEDITLNFTIDTNKKEDIQKIRINNLDCTATKISDNKYQVTYRASEESGVQELNITKVTYVDSETVDVNGQTKIEVLKDKPSIQSVVQEDNLNESNVTLKFEVLDKDESFISGEVVLKDTKTNTIEKKDIKKGSNSISFVVEENKQYEIDIYGTYDRDTNSLEGHESNENKVINDLLYKGVVELIGDYKLKVSNVLVYKEGLEAKYFNKKEEIDVRFASTNITKFKPEKAVINGKEYEVLEEGNVYKANISGFDSAGKKEIKIEKIILSNSKELLVTENNSIEIEVLKDKPIVNEFEYKEIDNNQIELTFNVVDTENAIQIGEIVIYDENQSEIKKQQIALGVNNVVFDKNSSETYSVEIVASYDLDNNTFENGKNEYQNQSLLKEEVIVETTNRMLEMKDVLDVIVYKKETDRNTGKITYEELNKLTYPYVKYYPDDYIARIKMKDMPDFYSRINDYRLEDGKCYLVVEYDDNLIQYTDGGKKQNKLEVLYGDVHGSYAISNSFSNLMARIKANPNGTFVLTKDYDASSYPSDKTSLAGENFNFKGTIDGNGHTIRNLNGPLFDILDKATIKNLTLENIYLGNVSASQVGESSTFKGAALANTAYSDTHISNVHVKDLKIITRFYGNQYGGIIGRAQGGSEPVTIKDCSVTNIEIKGSGQRDSEGGQVGGIAGVIQNTIIENCYVEGTIKAKVGVGGIVGEINSTQPSGTRSIIKNCISKVNLTSTAGRSGGILGIASSAVTLTKNVSLSTGSNANRIYGDGRISFNGTNIAISESTLNENKGNNIKTISKDEFSAKTLKQLDFSEDKWNLENSSYDSLPSLKNDDPRNNEQGEFIGTNIYIPNYELLKKMKDYDINKQTLYSNLYKLIPFYDSKYIIIDGKKISEDHVLNKKLINSVLAFDENKNVMTYLTEENYDRISSIKVVFEDGTAENYNVTYKYKDTVEPRKMYGRVAMYKIDDLGIEYTYDKYIIKQDAKIIDELVQYIQSLEYDKDLKNFIDIHEPDKRGYKVLKEYFNDVIRSEGNAKKFVMNLLSNVDGYSVTQENDILNYAIRKQVINNEEFKKTLLAYTYYSRFYGVEMGGTTVSDIMLFKSDVYNPNIRFNNVIDDFLNSTYKSAHVVHLEFRDNLGLLLGTETQGELIERAVYALTDYNDPNEWFEAYFNERNILTESATKDHATADYRAWTQLKKQQKYIMHILTLPKNSGFIVSAPGTFLVGSQMLYIENPSDQAQKEQLTLQMKKFGDYIANFYNNVLGIIDVSYLNKYADIQIDATNVKIYGQQSNGKCTDPFHVNFNDLLDEWFRATGAAAYATDGVINYSSAALTNYDWIWAHEIGHNQSYKLFFKGNGFRPIGGNNNNNLGTEDYTDGHTTQSFGDGDVNWNFSYDYTPDQLITTNLTQDRINSVEELDSYYKGMYESIDFLDYVEAKAFLKLTSEEKSKVAVQIEYKDPKDHSKVTWKQITAEEFEKMKLTTVEDLWDNKIAIRPGVNEEWTQTGEGAYGSEGMYIRRWYQPHNDNGRTHSWGFKYTAWPMLGIGGYENGYLNWYTGKSKTDLDAIKKITNDDTMTWKKFKKERYKLMEDSFATIPYVNAEKLVDDYVDALKIDASNHDRNVTASTNLRRINYHYLKRITNDFRDEVLSSKSEAIHISTPEEFKEKLMQSKIVNGDTNYYIGNFVLDKDIDLSGIEINEKSIIDGYFIGKFDGNGHKLIGNKAPIFDKIKFANISNLTIEDSAIVVTDKSDEKTGSLAKVVEYSKLEDIIVRNASVSAHKEVGSLVGNLTGSMVKDVHVIGVTVSGTHRAGAIAGYVDKSQIVECSANGVTTSTEAAVGGFVGEIVEGSVIKDSYSIGKAIGARDVGGFVGYVNKSSIINCFSNAKAEGQNGIASFVGQTHNNATIKNNITLANQFNGYKFDGRTAKDKFVNFSGNYENEGNAGTSTRDRIKDFNFDGKIDIASEAQVKTENFYLETLGWNKDVWDLSKVSSDGIPKLKNSDPNDNTVSVEIHHVKSADEFIDKIKADPYAMFVLDNNIDFSSKDSIIDVEFKGIIKGNGYKLTGNKTPIFNKLNDAKINGLILEGSNIINKEGNIGVLAKEAINSEIENVHVVDATIRGGNSKVGGLVGYAENSTLKESSSNASILVDGNNVGGLVGEITNSTIIENCYSEGFVQGHEKVGGLVGNVINSTIRYSYSSSSANGLKEVSGFIGKSTENSNIKNNIALGNQMKQYKFDGNTEKGQFNNYSGNYEYKENRGQSTLLREGIDFDGKISEATKEQIITKDFYTETLGWNESIWNFSNVANEHTPKLKNLDPNKTKAIGVYKAQINSVNEFITELTEHPTGEFIIKNDLDFSGREYSVGSVLIPGTFEGIIKGEGHTIKNLKNATIFEQFNGEVDRLNVDKIDYGSVYFKDQFAQYVSPGESDKTQSDVAVFAKKSMNAKYSNMKFSKITMFGHDNVAVVVSVDNNSEFENINVSQAYVNAGKTGIGGNKVSTFISEKTGGLIKNCYVHGELIAQGNDNGGIIGISHGGIVIENVVSNIYATNQDQQKAITNGLFIGKMGATTEIKNSASIGLVGSSNKGIRKFAGTIEDGSMIKNCYENGSANGAPHVVGNDIKSVSNEELKNKNFYVDKLGFDEKIWNLDDIQERRYTESVTAHGPFEQYFPMMIFFGLK